MKKLLLLLTLGALLAAESITLSGSVISDNRKMITSRFMGFVTDVRVSEGDAVKKGDLLYTIDSKEIDSALTQVELGISQAQLSLQMYQNQYTNVRLNLERHKRLLEKDMVSKFEVENLALSEQNLANMIDIAKKQVIQAETRLLEVKNQYHYLNIKAPNDGVIVGINIKVGEMAMPGMPALELSDLTNLKISAEISEDNLSRIKEGKKVVVNIPSQGIQAIGTVSAIIPSSNPMTHSFKIKISFKNVYKSIYPGMYATVVIE
ncbi:MAG: efflux transporter periplasmic adaptor subunit [Sulfurimonas sp. RIFCSPHIGHO2_12_FULL_36_9]|uniref:efflux RND transporter periplasmic adaptor subunit n=1 Tax=Sulfurimonas sp. RIFCSPLOWO2_12_36_12 TaxID=1802253 RepID=UPI0008C5B031|nr:efflux RND transporter periplasmic adaptor subunit [Sulfurimonas sp. RIFCSPLOWO2_12_36_12]OHD97733.1 MAG: efflux transporter periplasmic adaptor subunit [Sulfurimonas sp. RIFCSPLOWO2_02_FULL_36_28]OHD99602.1 MAG: efflux transporter periplasmic adaptor subunit [Sulfurimonas sp. RIFCSPHIGHO2_12_FULL_36_9]OHE01087.1 MAG: efflux transporter periplasmic adaptor subunit [Sulfurimonas sp. RIFCSPLOWO2_12_36_12]OHE07867.1 MAG: efflux transporter periplasmic adaptor subunit [Sulfurimonas sp. RIFCSPLOW